MPRADYAGEPRLKSVKELLTSACPDLSAESEADEEPPETKTIADILDARGRKSQINMMKSLCNPLTCLGHEFPTMSTPQNFEEGLSPEQSNAKTKKNSCIASSQGAEDASAAAEKLLQELSMQMEIYSAVAKTLHAVEKWQKKVKKWQKRAAKELEDMADFMSTTCSKFESAKNLNFTELAAPIVTRE